MTWNEYLARTALLDCEETIESIVLGRLQGRLLDFWVEDTDEGVVLRGVASSYHVKQLAQHEVQRLTPQPIAANAIEVRPQIAPSRHT